MHPPHFSLERAIRPNILTLQPYRCARDDYTSGVLLDANENALGHSIPPPSAQTQKQNGSAHQLPDELHEALSLNLHRYPDPSHPELKARVAELRGHGLKKENVFLGVGSDEVLDLLVRICVPPGENGGAVLTTPPTYGMYAVTAAVNDVRVVKCDLRTDAEHGEGGEEGRFSLRVDEVKKALAADPSIRLVFLCSPGNPTGTLISLAAVRSILEFPAFTGIVIVDEAYVDFAGPDASMASLVQEYANLCVVQTLSKSFGLAAIRLGIALAQAPLIQILSNTKAPYNISTPTAHLARAALSPTGIAAAHAKNATLLASRTRLLSALAARKDTLHLGGVIGANDANFVMVPVLAKDGSGTPDNVRAERVYTRMAEREGVVVRFRGTERGCEGCLRITVGSEEEIGKVLEAMDKVLTEM